MTGCLLYYLARLQDSYGPLRKVDHPRVPGSGGSRQGETSISTTPTIKGSSSTLTTETPSPTPTKKSSFDWSTLLQRYPVSSLIPLPSGKPVLIPTIQKPAEDFQEDAEAKGIREDRRDAVKEAFQHSWSGYKSRAWLKDELAPLSGGYRNTFGGWAATLIDSLDTLWILGSRDDFEDAVRSVAEIDFSKSEDITLNVFETTIRYLGGLLGAYDISGGQYSILLEKSVELGNMLYAAFDTPNRMPVTRWDWRSAAEGKRQEASETVLVSELTSLSLEFTRLSQLTNDVKYFDAIQRITNELEKAQNSTQLPGMWPVVVDARSLSFSGDNTFTLGGMSDSLYEYLPKVGKQVGYFIIFSDYLIGVFIIRWPEFSISHVV